MGMTVEEYRKRMMDAFHNADCEGLIALVVSPTEKEFRHLEWLLKTHYKTPKEQYEARLNADMVAMLTDIQLEIEEHEESIIGHYGKETKESDFPSHKIERNNGRKECINLIQQKINALKAESEGKE